MEHFAQKIDSSANLIIDVWDETVDVRTFSDLIDIFLDLIQTAIPVIVGLALLVFFWGLAKFILRIGGDEKAIEEGKKLMIWGIIALFVMVSIWGILAFFYADLGFSRPFGLPLLPDCTGELNQC